MEGKVNISGNKKKGIMHSFKKGTSVKILEIRKHHYLCKSKNGKQALIERRHVDIGDE